MNQGGTLRAVTRALERDIDLDGFAGHDGYLFVRDGIGLAGRGVARRVLIADAQQCLESIDSVDDVKGPGSGPVALGCLPFLPDSEGELVIPEVVVGRGPDGSRWITAVTATGSEPPTDLEPAALRSSSAASFTVTPGVAVEHYLRAVAEGRDAVRRGDLDKVVIARDVLVESDQPLDRAAILARLRASFGSSYRYLVDGLIGASPELLVARSGPLLRSHPLAGTAPRVGEPTADARLAAQLMASVKNQVEHRVVIDVMEDTLLPWCSYLDWEAEPSIVAVANVQHLGTRMEGRLRDPAPSVLQLARALCPTPALGGHPRRKALELIARWEGMERGRYGGAVGWVDAEGNGAWAVSIRCAEISGRRARLFAGGGIVGDSDPEAELAETQAKFQAMLSAIVRP